MKKTTKSATIKAPKMVRATTVPKRSYRLPDGATTTSAAKYSKEWRRLGEDFGRIIGGELFGFDPDFSYRFGDNRYSPAIPASIVIKVLDHIEELKTSYDPEYNYNCSCNEYR